MPDSTRGRESRADLWASGGSVISAIASSACCWLPLVLLATGFSAAGAATMFERFRPVFLAAAVVLLAVGFFFNYRPRHEPCGPEGSCPMPNRRVQRLSRTLLWVSAVLVAAFALFPNYVGNLVSASESPVVATEKTEQLVLGVRGMTCAGCEAGVKAALAVVPGVDSVDVSYEKARAVVTLERAGTASRADLAAALEKVGYELAGPDVDSLSSSAVELREHFNGDRDKTRLVMLLSPT